MYSVLLSIFLFLHAWMDLVCAVLPTDPSGPSLVMAFIVRDEEVNIRSNLPAYVPFVDYYVFMVDHRTSDGTLAAIEEILGGKRNYHVEKYEFDGFGPARTASLKQAWLRYPNATHVWIADPDWRAEISSIKKSELTMDADAFRFLIYDRNGHTTRRCDWLIRNRPHNAMRYNLHEVLHIGESYSWKEISWIVREIEQKGSWHNKVGHASSHASKRYIFDLKYLEKDLIEYPNDPHTDYYLGVTHHAYVESLGKERPEVLQDIAAVQPSGRSIAEHMDLAIKYLSLRATYNYKSEFIEERWGVMFLLGSIHGFMPVSYNLAESEKWFSMCRDYNPSQMECSINLISLYMNSGLYDKMMQEMNLMIRSTYVERTMMNHYALKACSVPGMVVHTLSLSDDVQKGSIAYDPAAVKYMHAMALSLDTEICRQHEDKLFDRSMQLVAQIISKNGDFFRKSQSTLADLCEDLDLQRYLTSMSIVHHPCEAFANRQETAKYCAAFRADLAPPHDSRQLIQHGEYIGAANLLDIVHHVYGGDSARVFGNEKNVYRILFAQYFNSKNVYAVLKQVLDNPDGNRVEIFILPPNSMVKEDIQNHISGCLGNYAPFQSRASMKNYGIHYLTSLDQVSHQFDYIEYNGGMSRSVQHGADLEALKSKLVPDGVLGITVFGDNKHSREIHRLVQSRDPYAHLPFSAEPQRLVKEYLKASGFTHRAQNDKDLLWFLGENATFRAYSRDSLIAEVAEHGLEVVSTIPTALAAPYTELSNQAMVQKWKALGLSESDFVANFITPFRYTIYASKQGAQLPGRPDMLSDAFTMDTVFVDRSMGALSEAFSGLQSQPGAFEALRVPLYFQFKMNPDLTMSGAVESDKTVSVYLPPDAVAGLSLLPSSPTLQTMAAHNVALRPATEVIKDSIPGLMLRCMIHLERLNLISVWRPPKAQNAALEKTGISPASLNADRIASLIREHEIKRHEKAQAMKAMGFGQSVIDIALDADEKDFRASLTQQQPQYQAQETHNTRGIKEKVKKWRPVSGSDATTVPAAKTIDSKRNSDAIGETGISPPVGSGTLIRKADGSAVFIGGGVTLGVLGSDGKMVEVTGGEVPVLHRQSKIELEASFRKKGCQSILDGSQCIKSIDQVRSTTGSAMTSLSKLEFDLHQLRFIAFEYPNSAAFIEDYLVLAFKKLIDSVKERTGVANPNDLVMLSNDEIALTEGYVNSVIHLTKEPPLKEGSSVCYQGALSKMTELAAGLQSNDFAVMDSLLENRPLRVLTSMLLGSTVWFDAGNGQAFYSHSNDGFVFGMASQLADELAKSFRTGFVVNKYTAVAIDLSQRGNSAVFYGLMNEYYAVIWLNSFAPNAAAENDGIVVFGEGSGACLQDNGGSIDSAVHRDFVSINSSINIDTKAMCSKTIDSELIPRKHNRLTLIAPNRAFMLSSPGDASVAKKSFDTKTAVAIVFSLSPQKF